jgi:hypothetical protein
MRRKSADDARVSRVAITKKGQPIPDALDAARERLARGTFAKWSDSEKQNLVRLLRKVVDLSGQSHGHLSRLVAVAHRQGKRQKSFIPNDLLTGASRPVAHRRQPFDEIDKMDLR